MHNKYTNQKSDKNDTSKKVNNYEITEDILPIPFEELSSKSMVLWAKLSDIPGDISWLPLTIHMSDSSGIS